MDIFSGHLAFVFGLLGNIVSFMVYLAPIPTFRLIYKKKSSEGFQSVPYVVALFSAMLWIYYALCKTDATLLITINSAGCFIETIYIGFHLFYATKKSRVQTMKLLVVLVICGFGFIVLSTHYLVKPSKRANIVGWVCLIFSLCVFVAPLFILRQVIRTKSVEYMPFLLSFFLTLSAVMWFFYGLLLKDVNIAIPNVLGFGLGLVQMVLYYMYKNGDKQKLPETQKKVINLDELRAPEITEQIIDIPKLGAILRSDKNPRNGRLLRTDFCIWTSRPTFRLIYKKRSSEGFQSVPYVVALFSAMLWIYYAFCKSDTTLLITINSVGCFIETIFISFHLFYSPKKTRVQTMKLILILIVCGFGFIVLSTHFLVEASKRAIVVGWICLVFSLCVFVAPLCILRRVIQTKSVEYMPFLLSFFLTLSAVMWFFYGLLLKDFNIAIPNVLGFAFGVLQMVLYFMYKTADKTSHEQKLPETQIQVIVLDEQKVPELSDKIIDIPKFGALNIPVASKPTFYKIYKKKSTEGFQCVPYVVGLFSAMLWIYYAFLKPDTTLLITINSVGCVIQSIYISFFLFYATRIARMQTVKLLLLLNIVGMGLILLLTHFLTKGATRANIVGWICLVFSLCVFVAPLCVVRQIIRTKSVEYMPFLLSFFLTLSAVMWFFYGLLRKDYNIAIPNVLGFTFGVLQMVLYIMYKNVKKVEEEKLPEIQSQIVAIEDDKQIIDVVKLSAIVCPQIIPAVVPFLVNDNAEKLEGEKKTTTN
ncbi:hypothetical protein ACJIZ3_004439 [Penstemon smallii]|uniref:Bidirectional sugar transporter SWEET n=1 Tax=Penstemon smallii TaxID=265156 RepID=A0ABD3S216_9LAMI